MLCVAVVASTEHKLSHSRRLPRRKSQTRFAPKVQLLFTSTFILLHKHTWSSSEREREKSHPQVRPHEARWQGDDGDARRSRTLCADRFEQTKAHLPLYHLSIALIHTLTHTLSG